MPTLHVIEAQRGPQDFARYRVRRFRQQFRVDMLAIDDLRDKRLREHEVLQEQHQCHQDFTHCLSPHFFSSLFRRLDSGIPAAHDRALLACLSRLRPFWGYGVARPPLVAPFLLQHFRQGITQNRQDCAALVRGQMRIRRRAGRAFQYRFDTREQMFPYRIRQRRDRV
jgi:hypothetical protein